MVETETQTDMFGDCRVSESYYKERARVLDAAFKRLRFRKSKFKALRDRAGAITKVGRNVLDAEASAQEVDDAGRIEAHLNAEANRKGPISDALTKAAREFRANPKSGAKIVNDFLDIIEGAGSELEGRSPDSESAGPKTGNNAGEVRPGKPEDSVRTPFGRAGFNISEKRDSGGDQKPESDGSVYPVGSGSTGVPDGSAGNGGGAGRGSGQKGHHRQAGQCGPAVR